MKILIAPDSFKGSLTSQQVADIIEQAILSVNPEHQIIKRPMADGGEGTTESLVKACQGSFHTFEVSGPHSKKIKARLGIIHQNEAVIDVASAAGLQLVEKNNIYTATSYGVGELIQQALNLDCRTIYIGLGGSATNDGGIGLLRALGYKFYDQCNLELTTNIKDFSRLKTIKTDEVDPRLKHCRIVALCDVQNKLLGDLGASAIYGPQKGATQEDIIFLDCFLHHFVEVTSNHSIKTYEDYPGSGAAGGIGFALLSFLKATMKPGIETIIDMVNFESLLDDIDLIITGEGRMDQQTAYGKLPVGIAKVAQKHKVPVIAIVGSLGNGYEIVFDYGISAVESCIVESNTLDQAMLHAEHNLYMATQRIIRAISIEI